LTFSRHSVFIGLMSLRIFKNELELTYKNFVFPGGEVSIKLDAQNFKFFDRLGVVKIFAKLQNSQDFFFLAMAKDSLKKLGETRVDLILPYVPYARQDRVCDKGESFSLQVFCNLLNSLDFESVTIFDPHSDVTPALINNVKVISQLDIISGSRFNEYLCNSKFVFVSPDAGANKKVSSLASYFMHQRFIRADKLRDLTNGNIKEIVVYADDLTGVNPVIIDDLIDGGGTFVGLAKELKKKKAQKVILYVTHGIFSKGCDSLFENGIDEIWCTDSFKDEFDSRVNVIKIRDFIK
jgi:ribose-phosphate pyrophosphokinase